MDPSIMKMLEDDDDETMHSGADLEAFTAALNRDIGRDDSDVFPSTEAIEKSLPPPDLVATEYAQQESSEQWQISNHEGESMHAEHVSEMGLLKNENSSQFTQEKARIEQEESQQVENGGTNIIESKQILNSKQNHLSQHENVAKETIGSKEHQKQPINQLSYQQLQTPRLAN